MAAQEGSKGPGLQDLPTECLLNILHLTSSASSSEAMEQVCRGLRAVLCSVEAWKQRLAQDLGVRVSCDGLPEHQAVLKLKKLYKQLCSRSNEHRARFHGCYTDGGCDSGQMLYWVNSCSLLRSASRVFLP